MKRIKVISGRAVRELITPADLIEPMRRALVGFSSGTAYQHPRITAEPSPGNHILIMPAATATTAGLKVLTMFPRSAERGLPSVQGVVLLVDAVHGEPLALLDGTVVTELRTGAVSAIATDALARPDSRTLALIGAGVQGAAHLRALRGVRPWEEIRVHSRSRDRAEGLVAAARTDGLPVRLVASSAEAVSGADVVCTTTSGCSPVLADADVAAGTHVTAVGAFGANCRELPTALVARARLFADSRQAVMAEAGDILLPIAEGALTDPEITEIGEVLAGDRKGRVGDEVTVVKSLGLPIEDVVACEMVYQLCLDRGVGHDVEFE